MWSVCVREAACPDRPGAGSVPTSAGEQCRRGLCEPWSGIRTSRAVELCQRLVGRLTSARVAMHDGGG